MAKQQMDVLKKELYPKIEKILKTNTNKFKQMVGRFIEARHKELFDICPCDRIFFRKEDVDEFFKVFNISESEIIDSLSKTYYYHVSNFNPIAAKDPLTVVMIMVIRYFYMNHKQQELDLAIIYLSFSGKFYPSIHSGQFPKFAPSEYRHIMEYVVNNELTQQFDLKKDGNIIGAIKSRGLTWIDTYQSRIKYCGDDDVVYLIQQLHDRIKSFMKNIAAIYYEVYNNKEHYLTYDSDNLSDDNYHIADNDSLKVERAVERSMEYINSSSIDYQICTTASDSNVKTDEVKSIIEIILNDNNNIPLIKELIGIIIMDYFQEVKDKDLRDIKFISKSISAKPNTKDKYIIREKEIIEKWLMEGSPAYRRRRSREATKNSYNRSVLTYFVLIIYKANK